MVSYLQVHEWMAQSNLIIQACVVLLIFVAFWLVKKRKFIWHGNFMLVAVIVPTLLVLVHMGPTFISVTKEGIIEPNLVAIMGVVHGIIGALALALGGWLTIKWVHLGSETKFCATKRILMLKIIALWTATIGLGYLYYVAHLIWT